MDNFDPALGFIWIYDGFKNDSAPGEAFQTTYGITEETWATAVEDGIVVGDFSQATSGQCADVYRWLYWDPLGCQSLPAGADLVVFSDAALAGPNHEARLLQRVVKATQDGIVGPHTLKLAGAMPAKALIDGLCSGNLAYLKSLGMQLYIRGWTNRENATQKAAYKLAGIQ